MAQKLLLFWRKPARRCWWEGVELMNVEGVEGKLKVWIRRVWTLEMVSSPANSRSGNKLTFGTERYWSAVVRLFSILRMLLFLCLLSPFQDSSDCIDFLFFPSFVLHFVVISTLRLQLVFPFSFSKQFCVSGIITSP